MRAGQEKSESREVLDFDILREVFVEQGLGALIADLDGRADDVARRLCLLLRAREGVLSERPWELPVQIAAGLRPGDGVARALVERARAAAGRLVPSRQHGLHCAKVSPIASWEAHDAAVSGVVFGEDGQTFYSCSEDGSVRRWSLERARCQAELVTMAPPFHTIAARGERVYAAGEGGEVRVIDPSVGEVEVARCVGEERVERLCVSESGKLVGCGVGGGVRVWEVDDRVRELTVLGERADWISALAISPDGRFAVTITWGQEMSLWDLEAMCFVKTIMAPALDDPNDPDGLWRGHAEAPRGLVWSERGDVIVSTGREIIIWRASDFEPRVRLPGHGQPIMGLALFDDGQKLVTVAECVKIWDLERGEEVCRFREDRAWALRDVAISPDERVVLLAHEDGRISAWELDLLASTPSAMSHMESVRELVVSEDGERCASSASDQDVIVWEASTGAAIACFSYHRSPMTRALGFRGDGEVVSCARGEIVCWEIEGAREVRRLRHPEAYYDPHVFGGWAMYDGGAQALGGAPGPSLYHWRLDGAREAPVALSGDTAFCHEIYVSEDESFAVASSLLGAVASVYVPGEVVPRAPGSRAYNSPVQRWDLERMELAREYYPEILRGEHMARESPSHLLVDEPRDLLVASSSKGVVHAWRLSDGAFLSEFAPESGTILALGWGVSGGVVCVTQLGSNVHVWDPFGEDARAPAFEDRTLSWRDALVLAGGERVVAVSQDALLTLWDVSTGALLGGYTHVAAITSIAASASGARLWIGDLCGGVFSFEIG